MEHCNGFTMANKVEELFGTDKNGPETKIYRPNSYPSIIGMMLYLASKNLKYSLYMHQRDQFIHNNKASYELAMKRIWWYPEGTKYNIMMFNPSNKMVANCYAGADFAVLWGHENPQDLIFSSGSTGVLVTFSNFLLFWVSNIHIDMDIFTPHY